MMLVASYLVIEHGNEEISYIVLEYIIFPFFSFLCCFCYICMVLLVRFYVSVLLMLHYIFILYIIL